VAPDLLDLGLGVQFLFGDVEGGQDRGDPLAFPGGLAGEQKNGGRHGDEGDEGEAEDQQL